MNNTSTTTVEVESKSRNPFTRGFWTGKEEQTKFGELTIIDETCGD